MNRRINHPISRRALLPLLATVALPPPLFVSSAVRAQDINWQTYRRDDLGFEIDMPGKPEVTVETGEQDDPWITSVGAEVDADELHFGVSYNEFKEAVSMEKISAAQRMAATHLGIDAPRETKITLNGFPGFELVGESDAFSMILQVVIRDKRAISAAVTGAGTISANPSVRRFLDSFKLLP